MKDGVFDLSSGRRIYLRELRQYGTYEGLLEGLPTAERNREQVERLVLEYTGKPYAAKPYLIRPVETPVEYHRPGRYPFGTPSALPQITCIGRFDSLHAARNKGSDLSGLVVLWFQQHFAFPIDHAAFVGIHAIDWEAHAADMDY